MERKTRTPGRRHLPPEAKRSEIMPTAWTPAEREALVRIASDLGVSFNTLVRTAVIDRLTAEGIQLPRPTGFGRHENP